MRTAIPPLSRSALMLAAGFFSAGFAGLAQANDVYWSVGVASPGVSIGVSNNRPVVVVPAPVYVQPAPIYRRAAPVFVQPQVVYVQPQPPGHGWFKHHDRHDRGGEREWDRQGYAAASIYAPVQVQPQMQYGLGPQYGEYGGVYVQPGYAPRWR